MNYLHIFLELAQVYLLLHANTDEEQNAMTDEILKQLSNLSPEINFPRHV